MKITFGLFATGAIVAAVLALPLGSQPLDAQEPLPNRQPSPASGQGQAPLQTYEQQLSYAIGTNIGADMRESGAQIDEQALVAGIIEALRGAEPRMSEEQRTAVLQQFQQQMQLKAQREAQAMGDQNTQAGQQFLAENAKKEGVQVTDSGLQYRVIEEGSGASPGPRDTVRVHYEGTLIDGTVFDSSYKRGEPIEFPLNRVIAGWTEAVQLMKEGAKYEVFIPSDLGYGAQGSPPVIGPNATLVFQIELIKVL